MKKLWRRLILAFMQTKFYAKVVLGIIPFVRFTTYYTTLRGWKYRRGYKLLRSGHFMVAVDKKKLTTVLIPGEVTHAAFCVDKGDEWEVSEMTHTDYTKSTFFDICKESDRVVILECTDWDPDYTRLVISKCKELQHAKYDTAFTLGLMFLYCSELVYQSDFEHRLKVSLEDLAGLGRPYISPTGLLHGENVRIVWDSDLEVR